MSTSHPEVLAAGAASTSGRGRVELGGHQVPVEVDDGDRDPAPAQPAGGLEAEQPAAEHDRVRGVDGAGDDVAAVVEGAQHVDVPRRVLLRARAPAGTNARAPVASTSRS